MKYSTEIKAKVSPKIKRILEKKAKELNVTASEVVRELILASDELMLGVYKKKLNKLEEEASEY